MVTVRISETYDMKTTINKLGVVGIHTPAGALIQRMYPGLCKSYKFIRFKKVDVVGACASVLPADPLQVGITSGTVAPEDMFNPILYKAVTNESFDSLIGRIYSADDVNGLGSVSAEDEIWDADASFRAYYALLSLNGKFRKAMPQSGFSIRNVVPICHTLISTYGNTARPGNETVAIASENPGAGTIDVPKVAEVGVATGDMSTLEDNWNAITFRGKPVRMPKIPLHYGLEAYNALGSVYVPKLFCACLILPPAKLHEFYYRLRVTWTISFENVIASNEIGNPASGMYTLYHGQNYTYDSSKAELETSTSSIDTDGVDITKIMES